MRVRSLTPRQQPTKAEGRECSLAYGNQGMRVYVVAGMLCAIALSSPWFAEDIASGAAGDSAVSSLTKERDARSGPQERFLIVTGEDLKGHQWPLTTPVLKRQIEKDERFATPEPGRIYIVPPQGYLNFLALTANARLVLTDSGGIQAETTYLGIPCLTLRENTEWIITLKRGTNKLVGIDPEKIRTKAKEILRSDFTRVTRPTFWDGSVASRIAWVLMAHD